MVDRTFLMTFANVKKDSCTHKFAIITKLAYLGNFQS